MSADLVIKRVISKQENLFASQIPSVKNIHKLNFKSLFL